MTDENSVIEPLKPNEKNSGGNPKWIIIALVILLIWGVWLGVYFFNFIEKKTSYEASILNESEQEKELIQWESDNQKKMVTNGEKDFSYKGNFEFNIDIPTEQSKMNLKIEDFQILSMDKWLQSRVSLWNFLFNIEEKSWNKKFEVKKYDMITNEEKTYIKVEWEELKSLLVNELQYNNPQITEIIKHIFSEKYVEIDNAKNLLEIMNSNDEIIIGFIKWMMSPNARHYFQKYGISEKMKKKFFSKDSYKLLFEETLREDDKIYVKLKDESCIFAINLVNKITEDFGDPTNLDVTTCLSQLVNINEMLANSLYVTQDGDIETINYNGIIQFEMTYGNGKIESVNLLAPMFSLKYQEKHLSINFTLVVPWVNASLKVEQDFKDENKWSFYANFSWWGQKFLFEAKIQDNTINSRKIEGNLWDPLHEILKFTGNGDNKKGKLYYQFLIEWETEISKWSYSYDNGTHLLSIIAPDTEIKWKMINTDGSSEVILTSKAWRDISMNTKLSMKYDDNQINLLLLILSFKSPDGDIDGKVDYKENNLDMNILINDKTAREKFIFTTKGKLSREEKNITMWAKINMWEKINNIEIMNWTIKWDENSCDIEIIVPWFDIDFNESPDMEKKVVINLNKNIEWSKTTKDGAIKATESGETMISADWKLDYSNEWVEYNIPTNTKEIDIPGFTRIYIPNLSWIFDLIKNK